MTPPLVLRTAARWATQRTRGLGHGVRAIHRSRQRLSAIGADDGAAARPSAADTGLSLHRYVIGRNVTQQGQRAHLTLIVLPPAPVLPRSPGAKTSSPYLDTSRSLSTARSGPAPADLSRHTACLDPGGSAPGGGACPTPRPG